MADEPTKEELEQQARELGIEGRSSMNKDELAKAVQAEQGGDGSGEGSTEHQSSQTGRIQKADEVDNDGNSLLDDDEAYIGTAVEYRNSAYETTAPMLSEDKEVKEAEKLMKAAEVDRAEKGLENGVRGFREDLTHPSERKNASDEAYKNRVKLEEQAREEARQEANGE